jgi:hypothetical protein
MKSILLLAAAILVAYPALAELPLVGADEVPERLGSVEEDGFHVFHRTALEELRFDGFSLGGSDDLPAADADRLRGLVGNLGPNQWIFLQATADTTGWHVYREKEDHRLDVSVAVARTLWGLDNLERKRVTLLPPKLADTRRGLAVYIASYEEEIIPFPEPAPPPAPPPPAPVVMRPSHPYRIGLEAGLGFLRTGGVSMTTPTVDLVLEKEEVRLDVGVGWWPAGDNELGNLADGSAKVTLAWFPHGGSIGPFLGWASSSQFVREFTEYVLFAHGPAVGVMARSNWRVLDGALRVGYARVSLDELNREERWTNALVVAAQVGKVF